VKPTDAGGYKRIRGPGVAGVAGATRSQPLTGLEIFGVTYP